MSKYSHLLPELDLIEAFGFWLRNSSSEWSVSRPAIERTLEGDQHPIFVLYRHGVPVGTYTTPRAALARIGNDQLAREYMALVSGTDSGNEPQA